MACLQNVIVEPMVATSCRLLLLATPQLNGFLLQTPLLSDPVFHLPERRFVSTVFRMYVRWCPPV